MEARLNNIPNFIKAAQPQGLRRQMLLTNIRLGQQVKYFDIQFVSGSWFAWYYEEYNLELNLKNVKDEGQ